MSFSDWPESEVQLVEQGLLLLGWHADTRLTSDDAATLGEVAHEALRLEGLHQLAPSNIHELAERAFDALEFQVMSAEERTLMATGPYSESTYFAPLVSLIDEATLCYFRGYYTASLASLFIVLENYLRQLHAAVGGSNDPSFAALRAAVSTLPPSASRTKAAAILAVVYQHYDAAHPPQFLFNRHGLLHGLRLAKDVDRLNCVRLLSLFDILAHAEGKTRSITYDDKFYRRRDTYQACRKTKLEEALMGRDSPSFRS